MLQRLFSRIAQFGRALTGRSQNPFSGFTVNGADTTKMVPGVTISASATNSTVSNANGEFTIYADPGTDLNITCTGYDSQSIVVGNHSPVHIIMLPNQQILNETLSGDAD